MMSKFLTLESANTFHYSIIGSFYLQADIFCPQQLHEFQLCENCFINECEMISVSKELLRITGPSQGLKIRGGGRNTRWG